MERDQYDYLLKFIIIGNSNAGKSCLLHYFLENKYKKGSQHTIGVEFGSKIVKVSQKNIKLQIWDTAGQERFRSVARTYYRGALGALVVYDITNEQSFTALSQWIKDARDLARSDIEITVVGNKKDLATEERDVELPEAAQFCQENGVTFLETSALTGENVNEAFVMLSSQILSKIESGLIDPQDLKPKLQRGILSNGQDKIKEQGCSYCAKG